MSATPPSSSFQPSKNIIVAGDPHGKHALIIEACSKMEPGLLILVGDLELDRPLKETYAEVINVGWLVKFIYGNHDFSNIEQYDFLMTETADNLHGTAIEYAGLRIGGLGGVFRKRVWYPKTSDEAPRYSKRSELIMETARADRWREGLPLRQRYAIFPEDVEALRRLRPDVLITHEAPTTHKHGFQALNALADACGCRLLVHGHHHCSYSAALELTSGRTMNVRGLGIAETWKLEI